MGGKADERGSVAWQDPLAPSALVRGPDIPLCADDGYPWALQSWDSRASFWRWSSVGMVPLRRQLRDLAQHARVLRLRSACRYVWVRHWTPDRANGTRGWRACIDVGKTIGPVRP